MKRICILLATAILCATSFGQGTIQFNNRTGPIDAPFSRGNGIGFGAGATAQLYLVTGSGASATYIPLTPSTTFRTTSPAAAFYLVEPTSPVIVPNIPAGQQATVVVRVWEGANYDTAILFGQSNPVTITLGGDISGSAPLPPALLIGLQGFSVPEPTTIALGILGAAALLYRRRK